MVALLPDLIEISLLSLWVTSLATLLASALALPCAAWLAITQVRARRALVATLNALMGLPPVVVGLCLYLLFSRSGPLGVLDLLYTPWAMVAAQVIIIFPLIASLAHQILRETWAEARDLLTSLEATRQQSARVILSEARRGLLTCALAGFGRAIGEVGAILIVGGNIDHATRVLTTAIALETSKGNLALAVGLGVILICLSLAVSLGLHLLARTERSLRW
ncbi:MAG: ABC transporter permease [Pseudomonadota bacterium]